MGRHLNAKKALKVEWEAAKESTIVVNGWRGGKKTVAIPAGLESTEKHQALMAEMAKKPGTVLRKDGDVEDAFKKAAKTIERTYSAPFLAHNTMEPVNCFAHVTADKAEIYGPIQIPDLVRSALTTRLGMPKEKIHLRLARMGGDSG